MMTLPGGTASFDGASYYVMNRASFIEVLEKYYNVFETPIDDDSFDKDRVFCNDEAEYMSEIYYASAEEYAGTEYNAQDVSDVDIDIPLK